MRTSPLMAKPSMIAETEKHMDGEIDAIFFLLCEYEIHYLLLLLIVFFRFALFDGVLDFREAIPSRRSSSPTSSGLTLRVSQIHLNYESMQNELRSTQDVLAAEQEDHRET
jgi:hypothetical protein